MSIIKRRSRTRRLSKLQKISEKQSAPKAINVPVKKKKSGKTPYIVRDEYFYEAKRLGYRARSAFKLLEIQETYTIIKPGMTVIDIASAPGSWLQVLAKEVGPTGVIVGIDIQKIVGLWYPNVHVFQWDVFVTEPIIEFLKWHGIVQADCITSDIAPSTTGHKWVDQYRSVELNLAILDIADIFLKKWGTLVLKVFVGEDVDDLIGPIKTRYKTLSRTKPKACRDRSFEEYFVCMGKFQ